jgi:hypothetical protein
MKHFILMILAVVSMFVMPNKANASDGSSLKEGVYKGALTYVYMNGDKAPYSPIEAELTVNANGTINLYVDAFKIGKMPGTITIDAKKITVEDTELHLSLRSDREGEYQQQADEHYISNCLHLYCHSIFSKSLHDFSLAMACFSSLHFLLAKRKRDMSGHIPLSFYI